MPNNFIFLSVMFGRKRSNNLQLGNILNNENIVFENLFRFWAW
jgi:hypothetical protein